MFSLCHCGLLSVEQWVEVAIFIYLKSNPQHKKSLKEWRGLNTRWTDCMLSSSWLSWLWLSGGFTIITEEVQWQLSTELWGFLQMRGNVHLPVSWMASLLSHISEYKEMEMCPSDAGSRSLSRVSGNGSKTRLSYNMVACCCPALSGRAIIRAAQIIHYWLWFWSDISAKCKKLNL